MHFGPGRFAVAARDDCVDVHNLVEHLGGRVPLIEVGVRLPEGVLPVVTDSTIDPPITGDGEITPG